MARRGIAMALGAYTMWGLFPAFFRLLREVEPVRILAHRAAWSGVLCALLLALALRAPLREWLGSGAWRRHAGMLVLTAALISANWGVYIYAVNSGQVLESSLGYFINPIVNVLLGVVFLGERLSRVGKLAVGLATAGVLALAVTGPAVPYLALFLAFSFGTYGLLRKRLAMDALLASCFEMMVLAPVGVGYLVVTRAEAPVTAFSTDVLLALTGAVSFVPLTLFALAAKRLPYSTMGLLQYLTPSLQFALAVVAFGEPMGRAHVVAFGLIWLALGLSSAEVVRRALAGLLAPRVRA